MLFLISLTSFILSANGLTRFVMDNYTIPDPENPTGAVLITGSPFPFDICLNYLVEFGIPLKTYYGIYTCNEAGTQVTFTDYGTNASCTEVATENSNDHTFDIDPQATPGDVGTFNCMGEDNYVQVGAYTVGGDKSQYDDGDRICCGDAAGESYFGIIVTTFATELCVPLVDGDTGIPTGAYTAVECDGDASGQYIFTDDRCTTVDTNQDPENTAESDYCGLFAPSSLASVYRMQLNCVYNGTMELATKGGPCTDEPTTSPTTASPTVEPTPEPSAKPTVDDSKGYRYTHLLNHIALLIIGMAVFVN